MANKITNVIIIGAGPAGIACAIQLKRYNINCIVLEKDKIGGLLRNANLVENYIGFPNGISGIKLVQLMEKQSQINKLDIKNELVESIDFNKDIINIKTDKNLYSSKYLVIASGTKPIVPISPIIHDNKKTKVFYDIYKLGQIKNKNIAIIGAGDCAFDYAINLCNNNKVTILNRSNRIKALPILQDRVFKIESIKYFENTVVKQIASKNNQITLSCISNIVTTVFDYILIAIGREPNLDFINKDIMKNPNILQIGDVKNGQFRQTSIAVGDGTFAAMKISKLLNQGN
jgi:thioredoxin reductase (NADPH)